MCGIAGIVDLERNNMPMPILKSMNNAIRRRDPDDEGYVFIDGPFGNFRLFWREDTLKDIRDRYPDIKHPGDRFKATIGLAHRRFYNGSLFAGRQPFLDVTDSYAVVFNGGTFNYLELSEELIKEGVKGQK